jgi:hypothetical protein
MHFGLGIARLKLKRPKHCSLSSLLECLQFANEILGTLLGLHFFERLSFSMDNIKCYWET